MKEIIATGKTVDLAIEEGCRQLDVSRAEAKIEVIDFPRKGFLGLKTYPAKVRVSIAEEEKCEEAEKTEETEKSQEELAVEYVTSVLHAMGAKEFSIESSKEDKNLNITLKGDDLGFVIGRRGETIDAIQYLASLTINRNRQDSDYMRITIDSGNFREKREKTLESLAKRLARTAVKTGRSVTLEPMNPYERRIIHATVSTVEGATSSSIGEEPNRRVVISSTNPVKRYNNNYKGKRKPYHKNSSYRPNSRKPQGEHAEGEAQEGQKKPYVFRPNTNTKEDVENRKRAPRQNNYRERRYEDRQPASNDTVRDEVPRSAAPSEAQDEPLYAKIDLE